MKEKEIIHDWLNGSLNDEEAKTALGADVFASYKRILTTAQKFKAPSFDEDASKQQVLSAIEAQKEVKSKHKNKLVKLWRLSSIAAAAVVIFVFTLLSIPSDMVLIKSGIAEKTTYYLPDSSKVVLNSNSQLTFDTANWDTDRSVHLEGEAYFTVAKGSTFQVISPNAITKVLGTRFNVFDRDNFLEVYCYHGSVRVDTEVSSNTLAPSYAVRLDNLKIYNLKTNHTYPIWVDRFSEFKSVTIKQVISEFENQFPVTFVVDASIDLSKKFTGKFSHHDLTEALQSFALPLGLAFKIEGNKVFLNPIEK